VVVELSRGIRSTPALIDITAIPGLRRIALSDGKISLGALTTHNDVVASPVCREGALPLAQACWEVGAPQLRTRGTVAGNLVTASPANDTITPLIALGSLAPTIVRARAAEDSLIGQSLTPEQCASAAALALEAVSPIDDVRGSAAYRLTTLRNLLTRTLEDLGRDDAASGLPTMPVLLDTNGADWDRLSPGGEPFSGVIKTRVNGRRVELRESSRCTLLDALRNEAGLTGSKEGCAEGECGACTVWLNGQAVMACLVPAPQAHNAEVTTIEGLAATAPTNNNGLHPLQQAFVDKGAVQCGYCIPGMVMAGAKLLAEQPRPDLLAIQTALSGNICRCTGYRKIFDAVQAAAGGAS